MPALDDDVWELYGPDDWTQAHDLAAEQPEKLAELQRLFLIEAGQATTCCRSTTAASSASTRTSPAARSLSAATRSCCSAAWAGCARTRSSSSRTSRHAVTAQLVVPDGGAGGVIIAQGGAFGGWSLYVHEGKPAYCYNLFGVQRFKVYGERPDSAR